ncbi:MAG TPA: amidohydrolase family protein [Nonomuraea sp.]|nr:amidohydrolase family protein [Nonomuraea sp.]
MGETRPTLIDADAMLGRHPRRDVGGGTVDELLAALDRVGIAEAVVGSMTAWLHDPHRGNAQLLDLVKDQPRLHPCWVMLPDSCGELGEDFAEEAVAKGVRAVRAFPRDHGYHLDGTDAAAVLRAMATARLPLLVDAPQVTWPTVESIARAHPALRIVVGAAGYRMLRQIAGVLERNSNVYLGTADLSSHCGLEWLVARFGAGRIVFGTGQPYRDPAEAVTRLLWSELGDADVAAIGRGIV